MNRLKDKVCVITGAGGGMGADAAQVFTEEGAKVVVADVDGDAAQKVADEVGGLAVQVDVSDEESVQAMYSAAAGRVRRHRRPLQQRRHLAGGRRLDPRHRLDAWERVQAVNTRGVFLCCKYGIPYLLERGGGSVINVASFVALVGAATSQISYTASKGAVLSMSKELGVQFARQGVRVNALCPGPVETPLLLRIWSETPGAAERRLVHVPMGRMAKPREIVNAALFLASDESSLRECGDVPRRRRPDRRIRHAGVSRQPGFSQAAVVPISRPCRNCLRSAVARSSASRASCRSSR